MPLESAAMPDGYIRLVWLLVCIIAVLMFFLCYLIRRAKKRESQNSCRAIEGLEAERRRVSRELHDTVLPLVRDAEVSALIRSICAGLMPPDFARLSLNDSLAELCMHFTKRAGIGCACSIEDGLTFTAYSPENRLHIYRMVQECFTNIEKHSGAGHTALVARRSAGNILICVSDDGKGIHGFKGAGLPAGAGLGITGMRQRAAILGAKLEFISESGNGLMVRIEIPPAATESFIA